MHPALLLGFRHPLHPVLAAEPLHPDRKSTRLNSSHGYISYAVFCLKKKKNFRDTLFNGQQSDNILARDQHGCFIFFFNDTATTEIYTLSLHDALPIWCLQRSRCI